MDSHQRRKSRRAFLKLHGEKITIILQRPIEFETVSVDTQDKTITMRRKQYRFGGRNFTREALEKIMRNN